MSPGKYVQHISRGDAVGHAQVVIVLDWRTAVCVLPSPNGTPVCQPFDFSSVASHERFIQVLSHCGRPFIRPSNS